MLNNFIKHLEKTFEDLTKNTSNEIQNAVTKSFEESKIEKAGKIVAESTSSAPNKTQAINSKTLKPPDRISKFHYVIPISEEDALFSELGGVNMPASPSIAPAIKKVGTQVKKRLKNIDK